MLARLHRLGPVGALVDELGVEQSVPSHHLGHLREAWLVVGERDDRRVVYHLHDAHVGHRVQETLSHADEDPACGHEAL